MRIVIALTCAACAMIAAGMTVEEARANLNAARVAYTNALAEAGITNTPRRARRQFASGGKTVLTKSQAKFYENRRIAVRRDTETIPGSVITTWYRNGQPDTKAPAVVTNVLRRIVGSQQSNPLQVLVAQWKTAAAFWEAAATNNAARIERAYAALDERREEYVQKRDAAALPSTKVLYQAFIDAIDRIKAKMEGAKE